MNEWTPMHTLVLGGYALLLSGLAGLQLLLARWRRRYMQVQEVKRRLLRSATGVPPVFKTTVRMHNGDLWDFRALIPLHVGEHVEVQNGNIVAAHSHSGQLHVGTVVKVEVEVDPRWFASGQ